MQINLNERFKRDGGDLVDLSDNKMHLKKSTTHQAHHLEALPLDHKRIDCRNKYKNSTRSS